MSYRGYPERDLVGNRSSLLLHGSTEAERRAWAEEAAANFAGEGVPLTVAATSAELRSALTRPGVVYVPDVAQIDAASQAEVVRVIREVEERPKLIIGLNGQPDLARESGVLRPDLQYALQRAVVNLDEPGLKEAIRARRARAPKRPAAGQTTSTNTRATPTTRRGSSRRAPARKPSTSKSRRSGSRALRRPAAAAKKKTSTKKALRRRR
ncbi:MAG: Fis family transcriptional regulator [Myxococcaceae bacterium]|nr:Fis family transcriptional regulator [Myxococcaceae bacterium]